MLIPEHGMNSSPGDLYRTQDRGETWHLVNTTTASPHDVDDRTPEDFANSHPSLACGGVLTWGNSISGWLLGSLTTTTPAYLFRTGDAGQTWQLQTLPLPASLHDGRMVADRPPQFFLADGTNGIMGATVSPANPDSSDLFRVIFITHDGGQTWQPTTPVKYGTTWQFITAQIGWMWSQVPPYNSVSGPVHGTLYRTFDAGITWQPVPATHGLADCLAPHDHVVQLDFVDENCGWALIREWNGLSTHVLKTIDGGMTWRDQPMEIQR
jgi:photosystem II stability/assembly factor-like uncharacterized protein